MATIIYDFEVRTDARHANHGDDDMPLPARKRRLSFLVLFKSFTVASMLSRAQFAYILSGVCRNGFI